MSTPAAAPSPRPFLLACPDLSSERAGNTDTPGVALRFRRAGQARDVERADPRQRTVRRLGAQGRAGRRPASASGSLTLAFCNLAAFDRFDPSNYAPRASWTKT